MLVTQSCGQLERMVKANRSGRVKVGLENGIAGSGSMEKGWRCYQRWENDCMD